MRLAALMLFAVSLSAQTRIASDFEIQQMEQQIARSRDFISQLSGHLNLGDLRTTRNESALARAEYTRALAIAQSERQKARAASELTRYATATSYAALAAAKVGEPIRAFTLSEEAIRYTSDSAKSWNLYATTMSAIRKPAKAASASRNAVALADEPLDRAIYQYTLASSLTELKQTNEAERLLEQVVASLRSPQFATLQRSVQQNESFEIYSTARGEEAAYVSTLNRAQLRLAALYEQRANIAGAREQYQNVLAARVDDPIALAALARLAKDPEERQRFFAEAFDANPFSFPLIREYQAYLRENAGRNAPSTSLGAGSAPLGDSSGDAVRRALQQMQRGELTAARATLDDLVKRFPDNDTLKQLLREVEERRSAGPVVLNANPSAAELRAIMAAFADNRLTAAERARLDAMTFTSNAIFVAGPAATAPNQTVFERGTIDGVAFRFSEPIAFQGTFGPDTPLRLTYRILGATRVGEADGLLLEPVRLEPLR
jgi:tetratricopeptide (TPR) repeat protein